MLPCGPAVQLVYPHLLPTHVVPSVILNVEAEVCRTLVRLLEAETEGHVYTVTVSRLTPLGS